MDELLRQEWTRRSFCHVGLLGTALVLARMFQPSVAQARQFPEGRLLLYNAQTSERLDIVYRDGQGRYDRAAIEDLNNFMRCHYSNKVAKMDLRVIEILNAVHKQVGGEKEIVLHSAYRSPEYHSYLVKHNRRAAQHSFHVSAQAIDFHIEGSSLREIRQVAMHLGHGGVGYYPRKRFLHIDSGPFRYW